jgi:hypothetical protein
MLKRLDDLLEVDPGPVAPVRYFSARPQSAMVCQWRLLSIPVGRAHRMSSLDELAGEDRSCDGPPCRNDSALLLSAGWDSYEFKDTANNAVDRCQKLFCAEAISALPH